MKDLTRREIALLCAYGLLLVLGIAWIARSLSPGTAGVPAGAQEVRPPMEAAPAGPPTGDPRVVRVRVPPAGEDTSAWRCFASRACPAEDLDAFLALPAAARWEAELHSEGGAGGQALFLDLPREPLHVVLYAGRTLVGVELADGATGELALALDPARFAARPARLAGGFCDASSRSPLAGSVAVERAGEPVAATALGSDGRFDLELPATAPAPATVQLVARFPDRAAWRHDLTVRAGDRLELGTIELPRAPAVRGELRRASEGPRAFPVLLQPLAHAAGEVADDHAEDRARLTYSEEDGRFQFVPVEPGDYALRVPSPDEGFPFPTDEAIASRVLEIEVREGELAEHRLEVVAVRRVRVQALGDEAALLSYELRDAAGHLLRAARLDVLVPLTFELPPGEYVLILQGGEGERGRSSFAVVDGMDELVVELAAR